MSLVKVEILELLKESKDIWSDEVIIDIFVKGLVK